LRLRWIKFYKNKDKEKKRKIIQIQSRRIKEFNNLKNSLKNRKLEYKKTNIKLQDLEKIWTANMILTKLSIRKIN